MNPGATNSSESFRVRVAQSLYRNRRRLATGSAMVIAIVMGYFAVAGDNGLRVYRQKQAENRQLTRQIETLKQENAQLQQHIDRLKNDPEAIEHEARGRGYVKSGEVIYKLPDAPAANHSAPSGAAAGQSPAAAQ